MKKKNVSKRQKHDQRVGEQWVFNTARKSSTRFCIKQQFIFYNQLYYP